MPIGMAVLDAGLFSSDCRNQSCFLVGLHFLTGRCSDLFIYLVIIVTEKGEAIMPYNRTKKLTTVE